MWREALAEEQIGNVRVEPFSGLVVEFARAVGAQAIVRGLRAVTDFELEFQQALMNRNLDAEVETLFMMPNVKYSFLSSNLVREVVMLGGRVDDLVPGPAARKLREKMARSGKSKSK